MKQRGHTPEQVIRKLAEGEKLLAEGETVEEVSRHFEISEQIWQRWRNQYLGMKADDAKRLKPPRARPSNLSVPQTLPNALDRAHGGPIGNQHRSSVADSGRCSIPPRRRAQISSLIRSGR